MTRKEKTCARSRVDLKRWLRKLMGLFTYPDEARGGWWQ